MWFSNYDKYIDQIIQMKDGATILADAKKDLVRGKIDVHDMRRIENAIKQRDEEL